MPPVATTRGWYSSSIAKYVEKHAFRVWSAIGHRQDERMTIGLPAVVAGHARICSRTRMCALRVSPTCTEGCGHPFLKYAHCCQRTKTCILEFFCAFSAQLWGSYFFVLPQYCYRKLHTSMPCSHLQVSFLRALIQLQLQP